MPKIKGSRPESKVASTITYDSYGHITSVVVGSRTYTNTIGTKGLVTSTTDGTNTWTQAYNDDRELITVT